MNIKS